MGTVILDSNVIIKHLQGTTNIGTLLSEHNCTYNDIIASEVTYVIMRATTGKSPFEIKRIKKLSEKTMTALQVIYDIFDYALEYVPIGTEVLRQARKYIEKYALLPNDAIVLATATYYGMDAVVTYDSDLLTLKKVQGVQIATPEDFSE